MNKNRFDEQFPNYDLIPAKKERWVWPLTWFAFLALIAGVPGYTFYKLSRYQVPTPASIGLNKFTLETLGHQAENQARDGQHRQAASNFQKYFALGGQDADVMALYASSLLQLGQTDEARDWADRATKLKPESKAARMIRDSLNHR